MDNRLEEIKLRDAEHQGLTLIVHEDRRWLIGEVERWRFGYTKASNDRDRERDKWIAAEREIERLRAALEDISESDHRNGYCGRVARRALAGEE